MLLKFKSVDTNSKTIHQMKITFMNEDTSSKNLDMLEVQTGESFTNLVSLDTEPEVLRNISFGDLKDKVCGMLHLKVVVRYNKVSLCNFCQFPASGIFGANITKPFIRLRDIERKFQLFRSLFSKIQSNTVEFGYFEHCLFRTIVTCRLIPFPRQSYSNFTSVCNSCYFELFF